MEWCWCWWRCTFCWCSGVWRRCKFLDASSFQGCGFGENGRDCGGDCGLICRSLGGRWRGRYGAPDSEALNFDFAAGVDGEQGFDGFGIEALAGEILNDLKSLVGRMGLLVRTVRGERVEGVGYGDHPRQQRDLVALQS